ncbi:MAG TPA: oligosaccharide flippase family protein, partial [Oscillatoriaceae cyanobacterium]
AAAPWSLGLRFEGALLKRALRFGLAFQGANLTALARDNINALLGGSVFGPKAVGYLNWGMNLAQTCSHSFVMIVGRVSFPAFARLHDEPGERERLLIRTLGGLNLITWPLLAIVAVLGSPIVAHLYGEAWRPALPVLWAFSARFAATNTTSILVSYLNATGRAGGGFRVTLLWAAVEWGLALALLPKLGFYGIAVACGVGALLPAAWLLWSFRNEIAMPYARLFGLPLALAAGAAALSWVLAPFVTTGLQLIAVLAIVTTSVLTVIAYLERAALRESYQQFIAPRLRPLESRVATAENRD